MLIILVQDKNTSLKLPVGVYPLQLINLHINQRYFVIKLHTWFCLSYILKKNIKFNFIYQYVMTINSFFNLVSVSRYRRPKQWDKSRDYTCYSQWPVTHFSTFYQFILYMLFNHCQWLVYWCITDSHSATSGLQYFLTQDSKIWKFNYGEWRIEKENLFLRPKC